MAASKTADAATGAKSLIVHALDEEPGTLIAVYTLRRFRFLLSDGRTYDVLATRDDSELRNAVLEWTGARWKPAEARPGVTIAGVTEVPHAEPRELGT